MALSKKTIHIICGIDRHCEYIKSSIKKIKELYPLDDIYICNFNSGESQKKLPLISKQLNIQYKEFVLPSINKSRLVCSEILAMLVISNYFYELEYENVYLLHGDLEILGNYTESFSNISIKNWSVAVPLIDFTNPREKEFLIKLWEHSKYLNSNSIENSSTARLTQSCLIFNYKFIQEIKKQFSSIENYFNFMLKNSSSYGDCGLFDCNHLGFNVYPILNPISFENKWFNKISRNDLKTKFPDVKYIHYGL